MARHIRALATCIQNLGFLPSTHIATNNHWASNAFFWFPQALHECVENILILDWTLTHKSQNKNL